MIQKSWFWAFLLFSFVAKAQTIQTIPIPDTLSGSAITLTMHSDSIALLPGPKTRTLAFNQFSYLGPTLLLTKGQAVSFNVQNGINDTTTVHWHGLHVPAEWDGGPHSPILPAQTWTPSFTILNEAALYWYHPHFHRKTAEQAIRGAAGLIIVRDSLESALNLPRTYGLDDIPLIFQSVQLDSANQFMPRGMQDSTLLVNGVKANNGYIALRPVPSNWVRLRLLNASGERSFNFGLAGNASFQVIGSDGGLLPAPVTRTRLRLSPGERYEILLDLRNKTGQNLDLMNYGSELPMGVQGGPTMPMPPGNPPMNSPLNGANFVLARLQIGNPTGNGIQNPPASLIPFSPPSSTQVNTNRTLVMDVQNPMVMDGPFFFNGLSYDMSRIDYDIPLGNIEVWELRNHSMVAHPFHIHDVQFTVLSRDGIPAAPHEAGRKDVVLVEPNETVRFITQFTNFTDTSMAYVFHCHVLMHEDDGMMGQFRVVPANWTSVKDFAARVSLFPNPTNNLLRWNMPESETGEQQIKVLNASGQTIIHITTTEKQLDVSCLIDGLYLIEISNGKSTYKSRFLIQR